MRRKTYFGFPVVITLLLYFMVVPLLPWVDFRRFSPIVLISLEDARNYFNVVAAFAAAVIGVSGLFLGYFYYQDRKLHDTLVRASALRVTRLEFFLDELGNYDKSVQRIMRHLPQSGSELDAERLTVDRSFDNITTMLELGESLLGMTKNEMKELLAVHSFVDNCELIMRSPYEDFKKASMIGIESQYAPLIRSAFRICYTCIARHDRAP